MVDHTSPSQSPYDMFLQSRLIRNFPKDSDITHVSLRGGSYHIPFNTSVYDEFIRLYSTEITHNKRRKPSLVEQYSSRPDGTSLIIDIDLRQDCAERVYTDDLLNELTSLITSTLYEHVDIPSPLECFIMTKGPAARATKDPRVFKDGIHLVYPDLIVTKAFQEGLRNIVLNKHPDILKPHRHFITPLSTAYDIPSSGMMMYGSYKPGEKHRYIVREHRLYQSPSEYTDAPHVHGKSADELSEYYVRRLSLNQNHPPVIMTRNFPTAPARAAQSQAAPSKTAKPGAINKRSVPRTPSVSAVQCTNPAQSAIASSSFIDPIIHPEDSVSGICVSNIPESAPLVSDKEVITGLMHILSVNRAIDYEDWIKVGMALHSGGEEYYDAWLEFSLRCVEKFDERVCEKTWTSFGNTSDKPGDTLSLGSVYYWCYMDNHMEYLHYMNKCHRITHMRMEDLHYNEVKYNYGVVKRVFERYVSRLNMNPISYLDTYGVRGVRERSISDTKNAYMRLRYWDTKKERFSSFIVRWLQDLSQKGYMDRVFAPPPQKCMSFEFNDWLGWGGEHELRGVEGATDISPFLNHILHLTNYDEAGANYFVEWLAQMFQYPGVKIPVCIIIISDQGSGKSLLSEFISSLMCRYYYKTTDPGKVFGNFNSSLVNNILTVFEELKFRDIKDYSDKFKDAISSDTSDLRLLYQENRTVKNYSRYLGFSNHDSPISIEMSDRRFVVFKSASPKGVDYYNELAKFLLSDVGRKGVYDYLMALPLSYHTKKEWEVHRPLTSIYKEIQGHSAPPLLSFLRDELEVYQESSRSVWKISWKEMYLKYKEWLSDNNYSLTYLPENRKFCRSVRNMLPDRGVNECYVSRSKGIQIDVEVSYEYINRYV